MDVLILWGQLLEELDQILICPFCCDSILDGTRLSMFWRHLSAKHFEKINENVGDMQKMAWIESQWHAALSADNRLVSCTCALAAPIEQAEPLILTRR
jgi:hypothetical protein